jgi:hypothetical protein
LSFSTCCLFPPEKTASLKGSNFRHSQLVYFLERKRQRVENAATSDSRDRLSLPGSTYCLFLPKKAATSKCSNFRNSQLAAFFCRIKQKDKKTITTPWVHWHFGCSCACQRA